MKTTPFGLPPAATGVLLGLVLAVGLLLAVLAAPPLRRPRLEQRLAPYVNTAARTPRLPTSTSAAAPFGVAVHLLRPILGDAVRWLDRFVGGATSVRRRLTAMGSGQSVEQFRVEQVVWGAAGGLLGLVAGIVLALTHGGGALLSVLLLCVGGVVGGVWSRDWQLSHQVRVRERDILAEFPVVAELLALAVTAGEGPAGAIERVCRWSSGELAAELRVVLGDVRSGTPLIRALGDLAERTSLDALSRFVDGIVVAVERGTPLADVLRAQAVDVRESGKRALLESGGRKEVAMMVPVVFLVLPVTVLFALFPGLISIVRLAQ